MTSQAIRDPLADHLITPQNAAFVFIDYQHDMVAMFRWIDGAQKAEFVRLLLAAVNN